MENLIAVYRDTAVLQEVQKEVDKVSNLIVDTNKLEEQIFYQLASYFRECEHRSFRRIQHIINREIKNAKKRSKKQNVISFSELALTDDFGGSDEREYEPEDVLANVGETAIANISLKDIKKELDSLATDEREKIILNELSEGHGDTDIARTLASRLGGKENSHRQFVRRFRTKCQDKLLLVPAI